jgi:rhamnosyltransferase
MGSSSSRITAITVCFNPERGLLSSLVAVVQGSGLARLILVDNSDGAAQREAVRRMAADYKVVLVQNTSNLGVAQGINIGLRMAAESGDRYVLLLDQDSLLAGGDIERLVAAFEGLAAAGRKVGAIGPVLVDPRGEIAMPFVCLQGMKLRPVEVDAAAAVECDLLITSGCLLSLEAVRAVGPMDGRLFVDYVDFDWCIRARARGYALFGVPSVRMVHRLGHGSVSFRGRKVPLHAPFRHYYMVRNALLLARKRGTPLMWRLHLVYRTVWLFVAFACIADARWRRMKWMVRGLVDGLLNRGGRVDAEHHLPTS